MYVVVFPQSFFIFHHKRHPRVKYTNIIASPSYEIRQTNVYMSHTIRILSSAKANTTDGTKDCFQ